MAKLSRASIFKIVISCSVPVILAACASSQEAGKPAEQVAAPATAPAVDPLTARLEAAEHEEIPVELPVIPDRTFNLLDYGAVGDGKTFNTTAFKKAIDAIKLAGGGHLIVPEGQFLTKSIVLTSQMDLHLNAGAVIEGSGVLTDYGFEDPNKPSTRPAGFMPGAVGIGERFGQGMGRTTRPSNGRGSRRPGSRPTTRGRRGTGEPTALISGDGLSDVSITGPGTIDGNGQMFWIWSDKAARRYPAGRTAVPRPYLVQMRNMARVHVDGVTLTNSPRGHCGLNGHDILIENVHVLAPSDAPNTDAINPSGHNIIIRNCEIDNGDDDVAMGGGSYNILIENLTILHGHGISIGSGTRGGVHHIIVRDCTFDSTDNGLRIKSNRFLGGEVHDLIYTNITMKNVRRPFDINARYDGNANVTSDVGTKENEYDVDTELNFHDIHVNNLTVTRGPIGGRIIGIPEQPASDITFTNCHFDNTRGFYLEDADKILFQNTEIKAAIGQPIVTKNAEATVDGKPASGTGDPWPFYYGD